MSNDLIRKLTYTAEAIQDITKALEERKFDMTDIELKQYGNIIRSISSDSDNNEESSKDNFYYTNYIGNDKASIFAVYESLNVLISNTNNNYLNNVLIINTEEIETEEE